jgi:hypothetical protein
MGTDLETATDVEKIKQLLTEEVPGVGLEAVLKRIAESTSIMSTKFEENALVAKGSLKDLENQLQIAENTQVEYDEKIAASGEKLAKLSAEKEQAITKSSDA